MIPVFVFKDDNSPPEPESGRMLTPEEVKRFEIMWSRRLSMEERLALSSPA